MFTKAEWKVIERSLALQRASYVRLSNRAGQPESVVKEYINQVGVLDSLAAKVKVESDKVK